MRILVVEVNGEPNCRTGVDEGAVSAFVSHVNIPDGPGGPDAGATLLTVAGFVRGDSGDPQDQTAAYWGDIAVALDRVTWSPCIWRTATQTRLSLIHISEPTRPAPLSRMPSSA